MSATSNVELLLMSATSCSLPLFRAWLSHGLRALVPIFFSVLVPHIYLVICLPYLLICTFISPCLPSQVPGVSFSQPSHCPCLPLLHCITFPSLIIYISHNCVSHLYYLHLPFLSPRPVTKPVNSQYLHIHVSLLSPCP